MKKGFNVYRNGLYICFIESRNKQKAKQWVKEHLNSTHMGLWVKTDSGYQYHTTIEVTFSFERGIFGF